MLLFCYQPPFMYINVYERCSCLLQKGHQPHPLTPAAPSYQGALRQQSHRRLAGAPKHDPTFPLYRLPPTRQAPMPGECSCWESGARLVLRPHSHKKSQTNNNSRKIIWESGVKKKKLPLVHNHSPFLARQKQAESNKIWIKLHQGF